MTAVVHMANEVRQMLYNFGYKAHMEELPDGKFRYALEKVEGNRRVVGVPDSTKFEAMVQAYIALLRTLKPMGRKGGDVEGPKERDAPSPQVTAQLQELLRSEGYEAVLEPDKSGYGWRAAIFHQGRQLAYTDYAATRFDALTHSMGFLIEALEREAEGQ